MYFFNLSQVGFIFMQKKKVFFDEAKVLKKNKSKKLLGRNIYPAAFLNKIQCHTKFIFL